MSFKNKWAWCGLLVMIVGVVACAAAWAVDGQPSDEEKAAPQETSRSRAVTPGNAEPDHRSTDPVPTEAEEVTDPALAEILEIRRRLGNDPFRGTIFETAPGTDATTGEPAASSEKNLNRAFSEALKTVAAGTRETSGAVEPEPVIGVPLPQSPADPEFVGTLRQAARALDNKAADLEPLRQYGQADQLRRLAARLRRQAREYDGPSWLGK